MVLIGSNCALAAVHLLVTYCERVTPARIIVTEIVTRSAVRVSYDFYERIENTRKIRYWQNVAMRMKKQKSVLISMIVYFVVLLFFFFFYFDTYIETNPL